MTDLVRIESCDAEHDVLCSSEGSSRPRNATRRSIARGRIVAAVVVCAAALGWVVEFGPGSDVRLSDGSIPTPIKTVFFGPQPKGIWNVYYDEDIGYQAQIWGEITHKDRLYFNVDPKASCDEINLDMSFHLINELAPLKDALEDSSIEMTLAVADDGPKGDRTSPLRRNLTAVIEAPDGLVGFIHIDSQPAAFWKEALGGIFARAVVTSVGDHKASDIFTVTENSWPLRGLAAALDDIQRQCRAKMPTETLREASASSGPPVPL
jgi:hypothetical protein